MKRSRPRPLGVGGNEAVQLSASEYVIEGALHLFAVLTPARKAAVREVGDPGERGDSDVLSGAPLVTEGHLAPDLVGPRAILVLMPLEVIQPPLYGSLSPEVEVARRTGTLLTPAGSSQKKRENQAQKWGRVFHFGSPSMDGDFGTPR